MLRRLAPALAVALVALAVPARAAEDPAGLARAVAEGLRARAAGGHARANPTDFAGQQIGCILMPRREMRRYGYRGHAFACEEEGTGEVLGAVLDRLGRPRCRIAGAYAGQSCYDITICGVPETLCVQ